MALLNYLPGMEIVVPGTPAEFDRLFRQSYSNGRPTYFRLSERPNPVGFETEIGKAIVLQKGPNFLSFIRFQLQEFVNQVPYL